MNDPSIDPIDDLDSLRSALYELLQVSFPPVGADTRELTKKHYEVVRTGCSLLGINPANGVAGPAAGFVSGCCEGEMCYCGAQGETGGS